MTTPTIRALLTTLLALHMAACDGASPGENAMANATRESRQAQATGSGSGTGGKDATATATATATTTAPTTQASAAGLPANASAVIGATFSLTPQVRDAASAPAASWLWSSSEPSVASVDLNGRVTALRAGVARIVAVREGVALASLVSVRGTTPTPVRSSRVGTNLGGVAYFATQFPFVNMLKSSEGWSLKGGSSGSPPVGTGFVGLTPDGYPTALRPGESALAAVAWGNTFYPLGRYVILWDGKGQLSTPLSDLTLVQSGANRMVLETKTNTGPLLVSIDRTDPADPVRNVRFLWPGSEATHATQPFTPQFLARTAPFSVLRFMDWGATNGSKVVSWADRAKRESVNWGQAAGVPIEVMIELANTLHVDPWFCIPHLADDDYVARLATLLRDTLDPTLQARIEYSNEVWNGGFEQARWAIERAKALGLPVPSGTGAAFYAQRSGEVFAIFDRVYGASARSRLVRVIAGQSAWTAFQSAAVAWKDTARQTDVLAIAPYFNAASAADPTKAAATLALTPEQVLDQALEDIRKNVKPQVAENAALAKKHGLKLQAYESGPHLTSFAFPDPVRAQVTELFKAANRHPRMHAVYTEYLDTWAASGGGTLLQYSDIGPWTVWGFWGALEYLTQAPASAPKYQALLDHIAAHPTPPR